MKKIFLNKKQPILLNKPTEFRTLFLEAMKAEIELENMKSNVVSYPDAPENKDKKQISKGEKELLNKRLIVFKVIDLKLRKDKHIQEDLKNLDNSKQEIKKQEKVLFSSSTDEIDKKAKQDIDNLLNNESDIWSISTFKDAVSAEKAMSNGLKKNKDEIKNWLRTDSKTKLVINTPLDDDIKKHVKASGCTLKKYINNNNQYVDELGQFDTIRNIVLVLIPSDKSDFGFVVLTCYSVFESSTNATIKELKKEDYRYICYDESE